LTKHPDQRLCFQEERRPCVNRTPSQVLEEIPGDECYVELTVLMGHASPLRRSHPNLRSSPLRLIRGCRSSRFGWSRMASLDLHATRLTTADDRNVAAGLEPLALCMSSSQCQSYSPYWRTLMQAGEKTSRSPATSACSNLVQGNREVVLRYFLKFLRQARWISSTYDHRSVRTGHPVRSAIHKH
jgi:hypothetical protein